MACRSEATARSIESVFSPLNYRPPLEDVEDSLFVTETKSHITQVAPRRRNASKTIPAEVRGTGWRTKQSDVLDSTATSTRDRQEDKSSSSASPQTILTARCVKEKEPGCQTKSPLTTSYEVRQGLRRRTIYIPSDDTSILTIHPGRGQTFTSRDTPRASVRLSNFPHNGSGRSANHQTGNTMREARLKAPQQAALLPPLRTRYAPNGRPRNGQDKENLLPDPGMPSKRQRTAELLPKRPLSLAGGRVRDTSLIRSSASQNINFVSALPSRQASGTEEFTHRERRERNTDCSDTKWRGGSEPKIDGPTTVSPELPSSVRFPLLVESLDSTEMYEANWLDDQESAMKQLVNHLLGLATDKGNLELDRHNSNDLRLKLLSFYQQPSTLLLYRKVQASLKCGSLQASGKSYGCCRVQTDLELRTRFRRLWIDTYDLQLLRIAMEVVVSRQIGSYTDSMGARNSTQGRRQLKRDISSFIDAYFLGGDHGGLPIPSIISESQTPDTPWQHLMLRCLMVIYLLDNSVVLTASATNLFQFSSKFKSTQAVLVELGTLFQPAAGSIVRPLVQLGYRFSHEQLPLAEYQYRIDNLATDLRDGVRLAFIVDMLLLPAPSLVKGPEKIACTIGSPKRHLPLLHRMKFPCESRALKLYNVQITLTALQDIPELAIVLDQFDAKDVVDGHREKSMMLLWALVGKWGLSYMIDLKELGRETRRIQRLQALPHDQNQPEAGNVGEQSTQHTRALKAWARAIAQSRGIDIPNYTTAFADGSMFNMVLDQYQHFIPQLRHGSSSGSSVRDDLTARLEILGCSICFCELAHDGTILRLY